MEKSVKIMLFISAVFLAIFVIVLYMDYSGFHSNIEQIIKSLRSDEPYKLQAAWYSVVMIRIFEFWCWLSYLERAVCLCIFEITGYQKQEDARSRFNIRNLRT